MRSESALALFTELAALPTPPGAERPVADRVIAYLRELGLEVDEDDAGARIGSNTGNLLCRIPATAAGVPIFLCAHLDTVPPEGPIEPVVEDGVIRNAAGTILGADDKAAVVVMLEAAAMLVRERRPHAGVELLFTPKEEVGLLGAKAFDHTRLHAQLGYVYDQAAPIGEVILARADARCRSSQVPGPGGARGHGARGGPLGDRRRSARDRRLPARPDRRGDDRERRRGRRAEPRATSSPSGARSRPRRARTTSGKLGATRPGDARHGHLRREPRRVRGRDAGRGELPRLPLPAGRPARAARGRPRSGAAGSSRATS